MATNLFHVFIDVAPLKPCSLPPSGTIRKLFHVFIDVAPLKPNFLGFWDNTPKSLPRLHRRGPIEAHQKATHPLAVDFLFHVFIDVAPLKRELHVRPLWLLRSLPRLHRRGPIEAPLRDPGGGNAETSSTSSSTWPH